MEEQVKREFVADTQREVDKIDGEVEAKLITLETKPQSRILGRFPAAASVQGAYIDSTDIPELLRFLEGLEGSKTSEEFKALSPNGRATEAQGREISLAFYYYGLAKRLACREEAVRKGVQAADKSFNPLLAIQAARGCGKSFFLDHLAAKGNLGLCNKKDVDDLIFLRADNYDDDDTSNHKRSISDEEEHKIPQKRRKIIADKESGPLARMEEEEQEEGNEKQAEVVEGIQAAAGSKEEEHKKTGEGVYEIPGIWNRIEPDARHYEELCDILGNAVYVTITFNSATPRHSMEENDSSAWLGLRVLWSYFYSRSWPGFLSACEYQLNSMPRLDIALQVVKAHSGNRPVVLLVDELVDATSDLDPNHPDVISQLATHLGDCLSDSQIFVVVSTLDTLPLFDSQVNSRRVIWWLPLPPLTISQAAILFKRMLTAVPPKRRVLLEQMISDCGGNPRTLINLLGVLAWKKSYLNKSASEILIRAQYASSPSTGEHPALRATTMADSFGLLTFQHVILALRGQLVAKTTVVLTDPSTGRQLRLGQLLTLGVFMNSLTTSKEVHSVIPRLCPYALLRYSQLALMSICDDKERLLGTCLRRMLLGYKEEGFIGQQYEEFHAWWEVMYRLILAGEKLLAQVATLEELYGPHDGIPTKVFGVGKESSQPKIAFGGKARVILLQGGTFPPDSEDSFIADDGEIISNEEGILSTIFLAPENNPGFDSTEFERRSGGGGFVSINWDNKYSHPTTMSVTLELEEVQEKYLSLLDAYADNIKTEEKTGKFYGRWGSSCSPTRISTWSSLLGVLHAFPSTH